MSTKAAVFLDRDNTLIHNDGDLGDPGQVRLIQGVASAIASLRGLNYSVIVVTNQGGVARGLYDEDAVDAVNQRINDLVRQTSGAWIDRFYYCPYHPQGSVEEYRREHPWRKPSPGMILQAAQDMELELGQCWTIGDQARDVQAGRRAGTRTILLRASPDPAGSQVPDELERKGDWDAGEPGGDEASDGDPDFRAGSLIEAVRIIAQQRRPEMVEEAAGALRRVLPGKPRPIESPTLLQRESGTQPARDDPPQAPAQPISPATAPAPSPVTSAVRPEGRPEAGVRKQASPSSTGAATGPQPVGADARRQPPPFHPVGAPVPKDPRRINPATRRPEAYVAGPASSAGSAGAGQARPARAEPSDPEMAESTGQAPASQAVSGPGPDGQRTPPAAEVTLREILAELRHQRGDSGEFSYLSVLAVALQLVAVVCLFAAFFMGQADDVVFLKWIAGGVFVQLTVVAALLFRAP